MAIKKFGELKFDHDSNRWIIPRLEPHVCIKLKKIFTSIDVTQTVPFYFSNKPDIAADLHWFIQRYPVDISEKDLSLLSDFNNDFYEYINSMEQIMLPDIKFTPIELINGQSAREYQVKGFTLFDKAKRFLLGDDIGLGKTLTGMLPITNSKYVPGIIVVQTHLPKQWAEEIKKFLGINAHFIKKTKPYTLPTAPVYVIKYSMLHGWVDIFREGFFKYACFDEAQELRRSSSNKYQAAKVLSECVEYCMGMTATPIYNYGFEIFNVMNLIKPGCLGTRQEFIREWCNNTYRNDDKIKVKDPQALGTYLRENFLLLRRTRKEVGRELPPINRLVYDVEFDHAEVEKSIEIATQLAIKVTSGSFVERGQAARDLDAYIRHQTGIAKARSVAALVRIILENGEPVLLAGWHRDVYSIWLEELKEFNPVMYTGTETESQKSKARDAFINGQTDLMIISLRSGIGLDGLQKRCNTVVVGEFDWSPKVHDQLIGRVDRDGQDQQVTAIFPMVDFGSDPVIVEILGIKSTQSHNIINPLTAVEDRYSDDSHIKVLAERFLANKIQKNIEYEN